MHASEPHGMSRRTLMATAGLGLAVPLAGVTPVIAQADESDDAEVAVHPVVGIWVTGAPTREYCLFHADGTFTWYNPWMPGTLPVVQDVTRPLLGVGLWVPRDATTVDLSLDVAWNDTRVKDRMLIRCRCTISGSGERLEVRFKLRATDSNGVVIGTETGVVNWARLQHVPFDDPDEEDATPEASA